MILEGQGERLRTARHRLGLGQVEMAGLLGVPQSNLSPWEKGTRPIPKPILLAVSKVCRISFAWLETGLGPFRDSGEVDEPDPDGIYSSHGFTRLRLALSALGKSVQDVAGDTGIPQGELDLMLEGAKPISESFAKELERTNRISRLWLMGGGEWMWAGLRSGVVPEHTQMNSRSTREVDVVRVPMISGVASCGPGGEIEDPGPGAPRVPVGRDLLKELVSDCGVGSVQDLFAVECSGESMRPTILPGDLVIINAALPLRMTPKRDALYLVRWDPASSDARIKRVRIEREGHVCFVSDAKGFAPVDVGIDGIPLHNLVLGRVCWISRRILKAEQPDLNW